MIFTVSVEHGGGGAPCIVLMTIGKVHAVSSFFFEVLVSILVLAGCEVRSSRVEFGGVWMPFCPLERECE